MKELELFFEKQINEHQLIVERSKSLLMDSFLATVKICIDSLKDNKLKSCVIGLFADPERLSDIRRNRVALMQESRSSNYTDVGSIKKEVEDSKNLFKKYSWPTIDVTRKSVEETAASIIKIIEIKRKK